MRITKSDRRDGDIWWIEFGEMLGRRYWRRVLRSERFDDGETKWFPVRAKVVRP